MSYVITRLMGGLGNQMFQYAAGLSLAQHWQVELFVDRSFLDSAEQRQVNTPRDLELDKLKVPLQIATASQVREHSPPSHGLRSYFSRLIGRPAKPSFVERSNAFDPEFFLQRPPVLLDGYWQNEKYFNAIRPLLLESFTPKDPIHPRNSELIHRMRSSGSVSLHVRRGDYVTHPEAHEFHGTCTIDHYERGIEEVQRHGAQNCFVFSDDIDWVRANLKPVIPTTFIDHNTGSDAHWDLELMRHCKHHIIANSSFSWWGAWLSEEEGITIAPKRWFKGKDVPIHDIVPDRWIVL
jgi:hypothetical protein